MKQSGTRLSDVRLAARSTSAVMLNRIRLAHTRRMRPRLFADLDMNDGRTLQEENLVPIQQKYKSLTSRLVLRFDALSLHQSERLSTISAI